MSTLPSTMQAVLLPGQGAHLTVGQLPLPEPGPGQVLVRLAAAPINPSDLGFIQGGYGFQKPFPVVPGFEGSGTVVAAGPGLLPRLWLGRRVTCSAASGGTWAEYLVAPASTCFPLAANLSLEQGATLIVNPLTALAFFEIARQGKHAAIVSNAAASSLGRMILRLGQMRHISIIHIVRRPEQVELLRALGGEHVLNSRAPEFDAQLRSLSQRLQATLILDPVAGAQTRRLLGAAPAGATAIVYGRLSGENPQTVSGEINDDNKRVETFFLPDWLAKKNLFQVLRAMWRVQRLAGKELQTTIQQRFPLSQVQPAIELSQTNPTAGKVLLVMGLDA